MFSHSHHLNETFNFQYTIPFCTIVFISTFITFTDNLSYFVMARLFILSISKKTKTNSNSFHKHKMLKKGQINFKG